MTIEYLFSVATSTAPTHTMKNDVFTNSTRTLHIVNNMLGYGCDLEVYSYDSWVADIFTHEDTNQLPHIVILGEYLHYSRTTTNHIKTAIAWLVVNYGKPLTLIDKGKTDIALNKPTIKQIKDNTDYLGVHITII